MLKTYKVLLAPDVNTGGESSAPSDVKNEESSSQEQDVKEVEEASNESEEANLETEETSPEAGEEDLDNQVNSQEDVQEEEKKKTEEAIPYERFTEVNTKKVELEQQIEQIKPLAQQATVLNETLREHNISAQEFQSALQYLIALRRDPQAAYKMLQPTYEQLAQFAGERLPADLQAEVAAGTLPLERAQQIARAQAQERYQGVQKQWQQNGQQQQIGNVIGGTISNWSSLKASIDPDLKTGTPLWEQVDLRIKSMPPFTTAQAAHEGCEKAYTEAKAFLTKFQPKTTTVVKKPLASRQSTSNGNVVMKTAEDVARAIGRGVKPHQLRYS